MSKKKVTLEEAKEIMGTDKIFYNGNSKFNIVDVGKYNSGITIEVPQEWTIDERRNPEGPIRYVVANALTGGMNIDFDGDASILLGRYRVSKNGRPVFELTQPTKAKDTLVRVTWGGPFNGTRGQSSDYAKKVGATFFTRRSSNGGGTGNDYWILPVDFVNDIGPRDVSAILANIENDENERVEKIDKKIEQEDAAIRKSTENRERVLGQIEPIIQSIKAIEPEFKYTAGTSTFSYAQNSRWASRTKNYTDDLISELSSVLEKVNKDKVARDTYEPMFREMEETLNALSITIKYNDTSVSLKAPSSFSGYTVYDYSQDGYNSFIDELTRYQEEIEEERQEAIRKATKLKREIELRKRKDEAREIGYPEKFEFGNRLGGATNLSHAYVIESDGTIREPDYNNLRNNNHKHKYSDWKNDADGTQGYTQILPGEVIISYAKDCKATPYVFNVEWSDGEITEAQLEVICNELKSKASFAKGIDGQEITDVRQWATDAVKKKSIECQKKLAKKDEDSFAVKIADLAEQQVTAREKNDQARRLAHAYEEQIEAQNKGKSTKFGG